MSTLLERLNRRYYRTLDPREQGRITADIEYLMAQTTCLYCGEPVEPGSVCFAVYCHEGQSNIEAETTDARFEQGWEIDR